MDLSVDIYLTGAFRELDAFSIPEIGTFRKVLKRATLDEENSQILPPRVEIQFKKEVEPQVLLNTYFIDHLHIQADKVEQIISDIRTAILSGLEENGYFEVPAVGTLEKTIGRSLEFFMFNTGENALTDDYYGLKPVRFAQFTDVMLPQSENPTFMNNEKNSEKPALFSSVGWKTFLLIALIFALGFLLVEQGPFVIHRSSVDSDVLMVKNLEPPRAFPEDLFSDNEETTSEIDESEMLASNDQPIEKDGNTRSVNPAVEENVDTPVPEIVDKPIIGQEKDRDNLESSEMLADNSTSTEGDLNTLGNTRGQDQKTRSLGDLNPKSDDTSNARLAPMNYHLIAGSFSSIDAAEKFKTELLDDNPNFDAIVLYPNTGSSQTYRVSIYRNRDKVRVEKFKEKLTKLGKKSGWIYEATN